ncbi:MAG: hypothetical protein V1821_00370 [bacterium]
MRKKQTSKCKKSGFSLIIVVVAVAAVAAVGAAGYFWLLRPWQKASSVNVQNISIQAPVFDLSNSPLPALKVSALNISSPELPASFAIADIFISTDFSYKGNTSLVTPEIKIEAPVISVPAAPATPPASQEPASPETPAAPAQSEVNQANCSQFSAMPSAQYCSAVSDTNGRTLCTQCKAAGF